MWLAESIEKIIKSTGHAPLFFLTEPAVSWRTGLKSEPRELIAALGKRNSGPSPLIKSPAEELPT